VDGRGHAFEALNTALLSDGMVIHVAAGVDAGLCQAQWVCGSDIPSQLSNFRLIIILEPGARLSLLEQFHSAEPAATQQKSAGQALNVILQAQLADDAILQHVRLQKEASSNILLTFGEVQQAQRSSYSYAGFDIGGGLVRHSIKCRLQGQGACAEVNGAFVLDHERHLDHHICIDHLAPSCRSEQFFRGVLGGRSRGVFNGKAVIRSGADGSHVRQSNANLLLSDQAEIDTKPELEIYADEVEASHGATVGSLDEQAVFYLRSRGIPQAAARRMLTSAFCRVVTARLPDAGMAGQIAAHLEDSMPELL
jgi:Fe-S cluster assembly protein SufD